MSVECRPLPGPFGVRLEGVDLREEQPLAVREHVRDAWLEHSLVLVRGQDLEVEHHQRFVEWFGPISTAGYTVRVGSIGEVHLQHPRRGRCPRGIVAQAPGLLLSTTRCCPACRSMPKRCRRVGGSHDLRQHAARLRAVTRRRSKAGIDGLHARHVYDYRNDYGTQRFRIASSPDAPTATHPSRADASGPRGGRCCSSTSS